MDMKRFFRLAALALTLLMLAVALSGCIVDPDKNSGGQNANGGWKTYTSPPPVSVPTTQVFTPTPAPGQQAWGGTGASTQPGGIATVTPTLGVVTQIPSVTPTVTVTPSVYKNGASGDAVRTIQRALKNLGYLTGSVDGDFGDNTEAAVRAFQTQSGLKADGVVGNATMSKLLSASAPTARPNATDVPKATNAPAVSDNTFLSNGNSGQKVTQMQTRLIDLGYINGSASGKFCDITEQAVIAFQKRNGVDDDGVAGPNTLNKLYASSAKKASASAGVIGITLKSGDDGASVRLLQSKLKGYGFYTGTVDGSYGQKTADAVSAFQAANGLKADGKAGNTTLQKLFAGAVTSASQSNNNNNNTNKQTDAPTTAQPGAYIRVTEAPNDANGNKVYVTLEQGHMGDPVKKLQKALKSAGYYSGSTDGYYGEDTVTAVKKFQRAKGLKADGKAGPATQRYLYEGDYPDQA